MRGFEHGGQILVHVDRPRNEAPAASERKRARTGRTIDRTEWRRGRAGADARGGRILPLGQAVNLVVEQQHLTIEVAPEQVHRVIATDRQRIAVAGDDPDVEVRIGQLHPCRHRRRATVDGVETVGLHVIGETRRTADAADEYGVFRLHAQFGHGPLHRLQDRIVAATGTPAHFLVGFPILRAGLDRGHLVHRRAFEVHTSSHETKLLDHIVVASIAASISAIIKG